MNTTEHTKLRGVLLNRFMGMAAVEPRYSQVVKAILFAEEVHSGMRKDDVTPEFYHQLSILGRALSLHKLLIDPIQVYMAILLHDCPEDYPHTIKLVKDKFPEHADNAISLSKYSYIHKDYQAPEVIAKTMTEYMDEMAASPVLSVAKLLDRIHNLSTMLGVFSDEKVLRYLEDVKIYFLPMLKKAKRSFPEQEAVYEIIKSDLNLIIAMAKFAVAKPEPLAAI